MTQVTHSYDSVESWNRNAQHIANATRPREIELPDWLTCTGEKGIRKPADRSPEAAEPHDQPV